MSLPRGGRVRCNRATPSPFVSYVISAQHTGNRLALDLGCGNGRNSRYLADKGFRVRAFDKFADQYGEELDLGRQVLPVGSKTASLVLCSYLLMFLTPAERQWLYGEIGRTAADRCMLLVELYAAKQSWCPDAESLAMLRFELLDWASANEWVPKCVRDLNHIVLIK